MSDSIDTGPAVEVVRKFIEAGLAKDLETMKTCITRSTLEGGQLNLNGPELESYKLGDATVENGVVIVPAEMKASDAPEGQPSEMTMPFVVEQEDGEWKIDMGKSVERMLGFNMEDMMNEMGNAMKGVMEGVADGMKQAFEGLGEAMGGAMEGESSDEPAQIEEESPEFIEAQREFFERIPRESEKIAESIGREVSVIAEWETFNNDVDAANKLAGRGLDRVRAAICLLNEDEQQALGGQLETIRFRYAYYPEDKSCVLEGSELIVTSNPAAPGGAVDSDDIQKAIRDTLDLERGPAVSQLVNVFMPELNEGVKESTRVKVDHQVEIAGFMDMPDRDEAVRAMKDLEGRALNNWVYLMGFVHEKVALYDRLWAVRFEHVPSASQRAVFSDGNLLIYRLNLTQEDGYYEVTDLEQILPGVIAAMPIAESPSRDDIVPPAELSGEEVIGYYTQNFAPKIAGRIGEVMGKDMTYDGDWPAFAEDQASAHAITIWSMHRVLGAVALWCLDERQKDALASVLEGVYFRYSPEPENKGLSFAAGTLMLSIHPGAGEAGAFYEHEIMALFKGALNLEADEFSADARAEAGTWQDRMLEEFKVPIRYEINYASFLGNPDTAGFARHILREHGIDAIYYTLVRIARAEGDKRRPNLEKRAKVFIEHLQRRVRTLRLIHVDSPEEKSVSAEPGVIEYRLYTDEGYKGYLTIEDLEDELPDLLAKLPDLPNWEDDVVKPEIEQEPAPDDSDRVQGDDDDDDDDLAAENFQMVVQSISQAIPSYQQALTSMLGHPASLTFDFDSLGGDSDMVTLLMTQGLTPVWEAIATVAFDTEIGMRAKQAIQHVIISRAPEGTEGEIKLVEGTLIFITPLGAQYTPLTGAQVTEYLKKLVMMTPYTPGDEPQGDTPQE